jgi:two-component system OmpR family sensor kinase
MFKKISITTFINLLFVFSFTSTIVAFIFFLEWDKARYEQFLRQRYTLIGNTFLTELQFLPTKEHLKELYKHFSLEEVEQPNCCLDILKKSKVLYIQESHLGRIRILLHDREHYIYIQNIGYNLMLKDKLSNTHSSIALFLFALMTFVMFILYINFIKKFLPLSRLNAQVEEFANGNLNIKIDDYGEDEIGQIAKNFKKAIEYINELIESKNLFMRNMLHELKTPITKGRIIAESIEDVEDKEILIRAFERMNEIISNLAQIEKLTLKTQKLNKQMIKLSSTIEEVKKLLLYDVDSKNIIEKYKDIEFEADPNLFAIVLKNLIDNGKKFASDGKVKIEADDFSIRIISKGEPLKEPFKNYIEPFSQGEKRQSGFGLGLYIVKKILDLHHFNFAYEYKNGENHFIINLYHCLVSYPKPS